MSFISRFLWLPFLLSNMSKYCLFDIVILKYWCCSLWLWNENTNILGIFIKEGPEGHAYKNALTASWRTAALHWTWLCWRSLLVKREFIPSNCCQVLAKKQGCLIVKSFFCLVVVSLPHNIKNFEVTVVLIWHCINNPELNYKHAISSQTAVCILTENKNWPSHCNMPDTGDCQCVSL